MRRVPRSLLAGDAPVVAPQLLNTLLVHGECVGRIVEVEAYRQDDPASHTYRGPTARNAVMFGPPGHLYVYFTYGMHHCCNVVTGPEGTGAAVLLRAVAPVAGVEVMRARRNGRRQLADGPGKLCQAFAIDRSCDGVDLVTDPELGLYEDGVPPPAEPLVGPRVGISRGVDTPWRFCVPDRPGATRVANGKRAGDRG